MKKNILCVLFLFLCLEVFSEQNYLNKRFHFASEYGYLIVHNDMLEFESENEKGFFVSDRKFDLFKGNTTNYVILSFENKDLFQLTLVKPLNKSKFKYGYWEMPYVQSKNDKFEYIVLQNFYVLNSGDYVKEKDKEGNEIEFIPQNFNLFGLNSNPWAVNAKSKKKFITVVSKKYRVPNSEYLPIKELIFVNGFISPGKDYLYEDNARAKTIRISYGKNTFETALKDTGNYQIISIPEEIDPLKEVPVKIEILDYYPGKKYQDIVISGINYIDAVIK